MMQVRLTVTGPTFAALQQAMDAAVASFLTGAPQGTTATLSQINPAEKVADAPAGWDPSSGTVLTLPEYTMTCVWDITHADDPVVGQVVKA